MVLSTLAISKMGKCMDKESINGQLLDIGSKENINPILEMELESTTLVNNASRLVSGKEDI